VLYISGIAYIIVITSSLHCHYIIITSSLHHHYIIITSLSLLTFSILWHRFHVPGAELVGRSVIPQHTVALPMAAWEILTAQIEE